MTPRRRITGLAALLLIGLMGGCQAGTPLFQPGLSAGSPTALPSPVEPSPVPKAEPVVPAGVTAGVAVYDRQTGVFLTQINATGRFRSASLVKVLIALDYLLGLGPGYAIPASDRTQLELMLRGSDNDAASYFYKKIGGEPALKRVIALAKMANTAPPSAVGLNGWGSTTLSANDMVSLYRYILEKAPAPVRSAIMDNLRASTQCGTDSYHQSFGIPQAFNRPWTTKQGWWGFGDQAGITCSPQGKPLAVPATVPAISGAKPALMNGRVLHSAGTVGDGDRYVVAVLTQYPSGTSFTTAFAAITQLARSLPLPSAIHPGA